MITDVRIKGFKRFFDHVFDMRSLTVLAGINGAGKTSVIHSLLLTAETCRRKDGVVELNGPYELELGEFSDVLNHETINNFNITISSEHDAVRSEDEWVFSEGDTGLYAKVDFSKNQSAFLAEPLSFQYLQAERLGPRVTQSSAALPSKMLEVGCSGQFSAQVLDILGGKLSVEEGRRFITDESIPPLLKSQTEAWLSLITRNIQIDTEAFPGTSITALKFRTSEIWLKPTNMGFGITYALPVILAGLTVMKGGILIVENPEAHLHPSGQSNMGVFLAIVAASGVQVIIETHSDHILNGIRLAIGSYKYLKHSDSIVHYFDGEDSAPESLRFTETGGVSSWPTGFFDQYHLDIATLTRIRRPR
jgi:predicted ATPase